MPGHDPLEPELRAALQPAPLPLGVGVVGRPHALAGVNGPLGPSGRAARHAVVSAHRTPAVRRPTRSPLARRDYAGARRLRVPRTRGRPATGPGPAAVAVAVEEEPAAASGWPVWAPARSTPRTGARLPQGAERLG
jgi:hypothetical protein